MPNKIKILISIIFISTILIAGYIIYTLDYTAKNARNYITNIQPLEDDIYILTKYDIFNPTYTIIFGNCNQGRTEIGYVINKLKRTGLNSLETTKGILGKTDCKNYQELLETVKVNNLSNKYENPDIKKFNVEQMETKQELDPVVTPDNFFQQPIEERYYQAISKINEHTDSIEDFKKLKKGMSISETDKIVGISDRGFGSKSSEEKKWYDYEFAIGKDNINFIYLSYNFTPDFKPLNEVILQRAVVVYKDRTEKELPIESLPGFVESIKPAVSSSSSVQK